jgi:glycosyltransferase involved in cell wall biosynthesis
VSNKVKRKITFVSSTALTAGGGTGQFILNVVKKAPANRFILSVVQMDLQDRPRLDSRVVKESLGPTDLYTIRSFRKYIERFEGTPPKSPYYPAKLALKEVVSFVLAQIYRNINGMTLKRVKDSDLIYLMRNDDLPYLTIARDCVVIGSTHCSTLNLGSGFRSFGRLRRILRMLRYRRIDGFHFTTAKWYNQAIVRKEYDFLIPLGTDTQLHYPTTRKQGAKEPVRFLFVSRLEPEKGITRLLDAWRIMKMDDVELHIAGTGSLVGEVEAAARSGQVRYHGVPSDSVLADLYRSCNVFVFPARNEIYGLVVLEALASGLFAIVGDDLKGNFDEFERMGMLEYVQDDPKNLADRMTITATNLEEIENSKKKVFEYIKTNHDWTSISRELYSRLETILDRRR